MSVEESNYRDSELVFDTCVTLGRNVIFLSLRFCPCEMKKVPRTARGLSQASSNVDELAVLSTVSGTQ